LITLIFPYRDRDLNRVLRSLKSLQLQTSKEFEVIWVDYGSKPQIAEAVKKLIGQFEFVTYHYAATQFQPWNKSRALNWIIKQRTTGWGFVADVDMLFHPEFVERTLSLQKDREVTYFKVGFLSEKETQKNAPFMECEIAFESTHEATGLTLFPFQVLHEIRGFDEFYHFWGAEDTDVHVRLRNLGVPVHFYEKEVLLLHQWHANYRSEEQNQLTEKLQLQGIVQLNHERLSQKRIQKTTGANPKAWGEVPSESVMESLANFSGEILALGCEKHAFDAFLYATLPSLEAGIHAFRFQETHSKSSAKQQLKKVLGKKVPKYYTIKEVHDLLLLHLISFYRDFPYVFRVFPKEGTFLCVIQLP
tara:strand:- start:143 stop:1225 length:1083 start_codon:yes stop_codon:yes gene_type:complete